MKQTEVIELARLCGSVQMCLICIVSDNEIEANLLRFREMGYAAFLRQTVLGNEIVVSEKLPDEPA